MYIYCIACSIKKAVSFWTQKAPLVTAEKEMTADEKVTAGSQNGKLKNDSRQGEWQPEKRRQARR